MRIGGIDHIAIAVENLDRAIDLYRDTLGLEVARRELVRDFDVEIATIELGGTAIELLEGKSDASPIRRFVRKRGPGLHHVGFLVDDIEAAIEALKTAGLTLIDETPRRGKDNSLVAFVHPNSTQKVLYELVQPGKLR
jgi:methylmalonyl-CoA/ethylmalonyl-CoA epimerase